MAKRIQRLFNYVPPPRADKLLGALFINREIELRDGVDFLTSDEDFDPRIYAIHGDSRTGKSHLARVLLNQLADRFTIAEVNANSAGSARQALERLFMALFAYIDDLETSEAGPDGLQADDVLLPWRRWFRGIVPLIEGHQDTVKFKSTHSFTEMTTLQLGTRGTHVASKAGETRSDEREITVSHPSDATLVSYLRHLCDVVWYARGQRPVLIYIDDLDLLTRRNDDEGDQQAEQFMALLTPVAENIRVVVVASVRSLYYGKRDKALKGYLDVRLLSNEKLRAVYQRQISELNDGEPIFTELCLRRLIDLASGRVGVFLSFCYRLWRWRGREVPITDQHFDQFIEYELTELMRAPETADAIGKVVKWIRAGATSGELPEVDCEDGPLAFLLVRPSGYGANGRVHLIPETARVLEQLSDGIVP
ncbi:MAG: AAA family ATPase [bacterium]|nr:ATP-binding protein [Myxococcales bacterium]